MGSPDSGHVGRDSLDLGVRGEISHGGISSADHDSLLALYAALADRGDVTYLRIRSDHLAGSSHVGEARRATAANAGVDLCFIDPSHIDAPARLAARFCRQVIGDRGVIVFHDRATVFRDIEMFLRELARYHAYPLSHNLLVVEINLPSLLSDPRVSARVPRGGWLLVDRLGATRLALRLGAMLWLVRQAPRWTALAVTGPRRKQGRARQPVAAPDRVVGPAFEIYTFANDDESYEQMRRSFVDAGFSSDAFVRLSDEDDNPFAAINRIGQHSAARYPILCHQDVLADQRAGSRDLLSAVEQLDEIDPHWVVAGTVGVMRSGRLVRRLADPHGGSTGEILPLPVVTLDGFFLVFNRRNVPRCTTELSEYHLYGTDVCLHALSSGGSAYAIDFPLTHDTRTAGRPPTPALERATASFIEAWSRRCWFSYIPTSVGTVFVSRSRLLRRVFGSRTALSLIDLYSDVHWGAQLRLIDRIL